MGVAVGMLSVFELQLQPRGIIITACRTPQTTLLVHYQSGNFSQTDMDTTLPEKSEIPVIDFSPWLNSKSKASQLSVAKDLISAFQTVGFAYIIKHNLPPNLINDAFHASKRLFSLDHETKMLAPHPDGPQVHRGYSHPGLEKVSQYAGGEEEVGEKLRETTDCKESYEIGSEENGEQPNVWLQEESSRRRVYLVLGISRRGFMGSVRSWREQFLKLSQWGLDLRMRVC